MTEEKMKLPKNTGCSRKAIEYGVNKANFSAIENADAKLPYTDQCGDTCFNNLV